MVWQKGDVIELDESLPCGFRLVSRGENLAVVVDFEKPEVKRCAQTLNLIENMQLVGGMADGGPDRMLVFSIPVSAGLQVVKHLLDEFVRTLPAQVGGRATCRKWEIRRTRLIGGQGRNDPVRRDSRR